MIDKKNALLLILLPVFFLFIGFRPVKNKESDLTIFRKCSEKLNSLQTVQYHYTREFIYPSEDYHSKSEGEMYVDFQNENNGVGFRYQYKSENGFSIFNNTELFDSDAENKTLEVTYKIKPKDFEGQSALYNSIITLRNILPLVIKDESIEKKVKDTLIGNTSFYVLNFETRNKFPDYLGNNFSKTTHEIRFYNKVIVDKKSFLPHSFIQLKEGSKDVNFTSFTDIQTNPAKPNEKSWYYSSYLNKFKLEKNKFINIIESGKKAPDFNLTHHTTGKKVNLKEYRGKLVLLEFWIKNCSYCISAVQELNALSRKYKNSNFVLLAINTEDNQKSINTFIHNNSVNYHVLFGNDAVNKNYGISAFPEVVLIDKNGTVIHAGNLDIKILESLIDKNL